MKVVINTTTLSVFGRLKRIDLLRRLLGGSEILIPEQVVQEYSLIVDDKDEIPNSFRVLEVAIEEKPNLGSGENACIEIAKKEKAVFVTDDLRARRIASSEDVKITGTLGLILAGVELGKITRGEEREILKEIYARKLLYIPRSLYKELLRRTSSI